MTLKDTKRICTAHKTCHECPINSHGVCMIRDHLPQDYELDIVEKQAKQWLKEHPEPIYPTYYNWLTGEGVYDFGEQISEEFAEKHNIKPIG